MNRVIFILLIIPFLSCKIDKKELANSSENIQIEVYNFDELEPLLNKDDETVYVINFWATWCAPCVKELPHFQQLHNTYGKHMVKVLLVSLDFPENIESQLIPFIKKHSLTPEVVLLDDTNEHTWISKIDSSWSGALPATLIYHKNRRAFFEKTFTKESLFIELENFLEI